jgi:hypothetical protein
MAVAAIVLYVLLAVQQIRLPGIYADELINVLPAQSFVHGGVPPEAVEGTGPALSIANHSLNIMTPKSIAFTPLVAVFGVTPTLVRLFAIGAAVLALVATFAFTRRLYRDGLIAAVALLLLVLDPSFLFYSRDDWGPTDFMLLAKALAGYLLLRWWDTGSRRSLALGMFVLGVGLWDKFNFGWIIGSAAVALAVVAGPAVVRRLNGRDALIAATGFVVGALPLIIFNLRSHFGTLSAVSALPQRHAGAASYPFDEPSVPGGGLASEFVQRLHVLGRLLDGTEVSRLLGTSLPIHFEVLPLIFLFAAIAVCVRGLARFRSSREARASVFLVVFAVGTTLAAAVTPSGFHGHHIILVYPLPHIILAVAIVQLARGLARLAGGRHRALPVSVALIAAVPAVFASVTTLGLIRTFHKTDGRGLWSVEIYDLQKFLSRQHRRDDVVTADWGLAPPLLGLSQQNLRVQEVSFPLQIARISPGKVLFGPLRNPRTWYVLHSRRKTTYVAARQRFFRAVQEAGKRARLIRTFRSRTGAVLYEVYAAVRP